MCSRPIIFGDVETACRKCNDCINSRKNGWVARAMAEKAIAGDALVLGLTYRNLPNGQKPIGAKHFVYADVQKFIKRLREAYFVHYGVRGEVRYIVCGEQGDQKGRVHYHMVLFTNRPLGVLGKWTDLQHNPVDEMPLETNVIWSMWREGMVYIQRPDQGGMEYALKYCAKDQFNVVNSKGTARESRAENYGASFFRMSKQPPIGAPFLYEQIERYRELEVVPTSLNVSVPDYKGYWFPTGKLREHYLDALFEINEQHKAKHGRDTYQWNALVGSVSENNEKDWEGLIYGQIEETEPDYKRQAKGIQDRAETRRKAAAALYTVKRCGGILPCDNCLGTLGPKNHKSLVDEYNQRHEEWAQRLNDGDLDTALFEEWWLTRFRPSRGCYKRGDQQLQAQFRARWQIRRLAVDADKKSPYLQKTARQCKSP